MNKAEILERISQGRTDLVFELLHLPDWREALNEGQTKPLQWFVYYDDVTALKAVLEASGDLGSIDLNEGLGHASFFGHWKVCDFLIRHGANPKSARKETGETPLHNALSKAGRPYYFYVVRLLVEQGADVNARTIPGKETGAFMRDVRTKGETPLHRAAAYADAPTIQLLLDHGADKEARDAHGDSPLTWASEHLRPGAILGLLAFGPHTIGENARANNTSDHGADWGNGMERNLLGDYLPESGVKMTALCSVFVGVSVDGFLARSNGDFDFLPEGGGEPHGYVEFMASVDALVIGRNTFEKVLTLDPWPYGDKRVVVLSTHPVDLPAARARGGVVEGMAGTPAEIVSKLASSGAHHLYVDGGVTIQRFLRAGLVQRLIVTRVPVLIGEGIPLFGSLPHDVGLRHVATRSYPSGLVQSEYAVEG